jgi:hypothetical protein
LPTATEALGTSSMDVVQATSSLPRDVLLVLAVEEHIIQQWSSIHDSVMLQ